MLKIVAAILALGLTMSTALHEASAEDAKGAQSIALPPGAKADIHGNSAMISGGGGGGNGVSGTYDCTCSGGKGTCLISTSGGLLTCSNGPPGAKSCTATCQLIVSTPGVMGEQPAAKAPPAATKAPLPAKVPPAAKSQ